VASQKCSRHHDAFRATKPIVVIATDAELGNLEAQAFHEQMGFRESYRIVKYRKPL
jgi:hypothetical protein